MTKIVLHGLPETYWETFIDILNIDVSRYIEGMSHIGKNGSQLTTKNLTHQYRKD